LGYALITLMGHAVWMAGLVVRALPYVLQSAMVTVFGALTHAW
jgi:hypothetical protein